MMDRKLYLLQIKPQAILALPADGGAVETIIEGLTGLPDGILVDLRSETIIWTNMGQDFSRPDGKIERADLDGKNRRVLVGGGAIVTPKQITVDAENGRLYWCDREGMRVMRSSLDGGNVETLVQAGRYPQDMADQTLHCVGIAVDPKRGKIYWTQKGPPDAGKGRIFSACIDIPPGETPIARSDVKLLFDGLPEPIDLEIDSATNTLYWTDRGNLAGGNSLNRTRLTDSGAGKHEVLAEGLDEGIGLALDTDANRAFVSDLSGAVRVTALEERAAFKTIAALGSLTGIAYPKI